MKLFAYYIQSMVLPAILLYATFKIFGNYAFVSGLLFYAIVYRPIVDGRRLINLGVIDKKNFWKTFIPFYCTRNIYELYFRL